MDGSKVNSISHLPCAQIPFKNFAINTAGDEQLGNVCCRGGARNGQRDDLLRVAFEMVDGTQVVYAPHMDFASRGSRHYPPLRNESHGADAGALSVGPVAPQHLSSIQVTDADAGFAVGR